MAVSACGFSVIVRNKTLEDRLPGGLSAFRELCPNQTFCTDGQISRVGFMHSSDANAFIAKLGAAGLVPFKENVSVDVALTDELFGLYHACDWLEIGKIDGRPAVRLSRAEPVDFFIPEFELRAEPHRAISKRELRESFEFLEIRGNVETYRNKRTGEVMYIGRACVQTPRKWWQFWK